jgi:hypothetical protein
MTATNQTYLPTYQELYVEPLNLTSAALKSGAPYFGQYCDQQSKVKFNTRQICHKKKSINGVNFYSKKRNICYVELRKKIRESV